MSDVEFNNACEAYEFVINHPRLLYRGSLNPLIEITPHMVNNEGYISDVIEDNVCIEWWIECGPYMDDENQGGMVSFHDYELDCGGDTADEAMIKLAKLVYEKYGV